MQFGDRGLNQIMNNAALGDARVSEARDRIAPLIEQLVERAKARGRRPTRPRPDRPDLHPAGLSAIMDSSRAIDPDLYRRYLTIFLDGIRTDRTSFTAAARAGAHRGADARGHDTKASKVTPLVRHA